MRKSDFLKILEAFPERKQLQERSISELVLRYTFMNFANMNRKLKHHQLHLNMPDDEKKWFQLLSFFAISTEYLAMEDIRQYDLTPPKTTEILNESSFEVWEGIRRKFNEKFHNSKEVIQEITGITIDELKEFAESKETKLL